VRGTHRYSPYLTRNTYISATEPNRLMLFRETAADYCENHTEHTDTVRTSQETYYVSATEPNRLMLYGETVAVYCENHTEHNAADCREFFRKLQ
jgi:predicted Zn-dependent protease with MMP-like domain